MNIESKVSGHWTDDQLIEYLYGVADGTGNGNTTHVDTCAECRARLASMRLRRQSIEAAAGEDVSFDFLAAQRRRIYGRVDQKSGWMTRGRAWLTAAASVLLLAGGLLYYEQANVTHTPELSDAQLAQDVSTLAQNPEPNATDPLKALFEE